jgi:hypothetical protein
MAMASRPERRGFLTPAVLALSGLCAAALLCVGPRLPHGPAVLAQTGGASAAMPAHEPAGMTPAERALAALKDTHLFWGPALELDDDDGTGKPQAWRDSDHNLQAMAQDALDFCDELRDQESRGEEAVEGQGQGRKRRCVHRVVSPHDTRFTHTPEGLNDWTQPLQNSDMDGEGVGPEYSHAVTLMKVINQFKPRTSLHGHTIYKDGIMVRIPTYDTTRSRGFRGASREVDLLHGTSAGNTKFGDFTLDSDADASGDEAYDQLALDAEKMIWDGKPPPKPAPTVKKAAARDAPQAPRTSLVKEKFGKFTIWKHLPVQPPAPLVPANKLWDPLMSRALQASRGRRREITQLYGPDAARVQTPEQAARAGREEEAAAHSLSHKQLRLQRLWDVTDQINVGATPPIPAASVVTQTQSVVLPGVQYFAPPSGSNGFAMVQPGPPGYTVGSGEQQFASAAALWGLLGAAGMAAPASMMPSANVAARATPCGTPYLPACGQGVVVPGTSAVVAQPYAGFAQWMQPPPIAYAQLPPPPVYSYKVSSSVTRTTQSPPASVTQVETVKQPWAAMSNLPTDTSIVEDEVEVPEPVDPNKFHVHVEGVPSGCGAGNFYFFFKN